MAITQSRNKIGASRGEPKRRIWLEGDRVLAAGFAVGMYYRKAWDADSLTLTVEGVKGPRMESGKVSGKGDRPVIDIVGDAVFGVFGAHCDEVEVTYSPGRIVIRRACA